MLLHLPFTAGAPVVIMARFDPVQFCANIEKYKITIAMIVPPVLVVFARHPGKCIFTSFSRRSLTYYY